MVGSMAPSLSLPTVGSVVLLALAVLSSLFQYIPSTSLAAIIIAAVIQLIDVKILWTIYKVNGWSCIYMYTTSITILVLVTLSTYSYRSSSLGDLLCIHFIPWNRGVCVCVCVCVRERERERACMRKMPGYTYGNKKK